MDKASFAKIYAFDCLIDHLKNALSEDKRRREQRRVKIALTKIDEWYKDGEKIVDEVSKRADDFCEVYLENIK